MFRAVNLASENYFEKNCVDSAWKKELENYIDDNKSI